MNIFDFAKMLDGRIEGSEITKEEQKMAKDLGFVVVFGYSDDNMEFRGAIYDEIDCYDGGECFVTDDGLLEICEDDCVHYRKAREKAKEIKAIWCDDEHNYAWTYETDIPHATFTILDNENGEKWCRGIVFDINELSEVENDGTKGM